MLPEMTPAPEHGGKTQNSFFRRQRLRAWIGAFLALLIIILIYVIFVVPHSGKKTKPPPPPVPVSVSKAAKSDFNVYLTGLGTVTPLNAVTVRTRVDGQLMRVLFREGQIVQSGDLLAEIDPRPFEVQLTQAEGQLARDLALLSNARLDLQRYLVLSREDSIPEQQKDTQESLVRQYEGAVKSDQGQIGNAKLQLTYSRITSPITGRVGLRLVDPGNIVHTTDTNGLAVITQLQPISVLFPLPEDVLPAVLRKLKAGNRMKTEAYDREQKNLLSTGYLLTVDNQVDVNTGTVRFRAVFPNTRSELFPNQFVNVRLLANVIRDAVVIPAAAIQRGPQGTFVYVVKPDRTAAMRPVEIGDTQEGETVVRSGVSFGDLVVTEGVERLREGARVEVLPGGRGAAPRGR